MINSQICPVAEKGKYNLKSPGAKILIEISEDHFITDKIETIEKAVTPIIKQLNSAGEETAFNNYQLLKGFLELQ